jgi:hypothetical protein
MAPERPSSEPPPATAAPSGADLTVAANLATGRAAGPAPEGERLSAGPGLWHDRGRSWWYPNPVAPSDRIR